MRKLIAILFIVSACGAPDTEFDSTDPRIEPYLAELRAMSRDYAGRELQTDIPINIKDLPTSGSCRKRRRAGQESREIFIDREYFEKTDRYSILSTLLHEIGHCIYNRSHTTETMESFGSQISDSIMGERGVPGFFFERNLAHYWEEFYSE